MAGLRRRGHDPVLRPAPLRIGSDQVEPEQDPRRTHRLALFKRAQAGAEGVSADGERRLPMTLIHTRRHFLARLSIAAAAGATGTRYTRAADGDPETRSVRIFANRPGICVAPQYIAEPLLRAEGFTDVRFVGLTSITGAPAAEAVGS